MNRSTVIPDYSNEKKKNKRSAFITLFFFMFILVGVAFMRYRYVQYLEQEDELLMKEYVITKGTIYENKSTGKAGKVINYSFNYVGGEEKRSLETTQFCTYYMESKFMTFKGKEFVVIYYPHDPKISRMLICKKEFEKFNIPWDSYSDSVYQEYKNICYCDNE